MENWKRIKDFPNYEISNYGRIKNKNNRLLSPFFKQKGYLQVKLFNNKVRKGMSVHRLVAQAFIPNPNGLNCINHINGIKTDNRVENLEWCSVLENNKHALQTGLRKPLSKEKRKEASERMKNRCLKINRRYREIIGINLITGEQKEYHRIVDTKKDGFNPSNVYANCKGKTRWHKGWYWFYKEAGSELGYLEKIKSEYIKYKKGGMGKCLN